jgi:hypothetical protein
MAALLLLVSVPRLAHAQSPPLELEWRAPPECPQRAALLERVHKLLGGAASGPGTVRADGEIQKDGDAFELRLRVDDGDKIGERRVRALQCAELGGAAAVSLALLLTSGSMDSATDDGWGTHRTEHRGQVGNGSHPARPPRATETVVPRAPIEKDAGDSDGAARRWWHVLVAAPQALVVFGPLPKPGWGVGFGAGVEGAGWSLRVLGQWSASQSIAAEATGYGAEARRLSAGLWGCRELVSGRWSIAPCLVLTVAHLRATGYGPFLSPESQSKTWLGVGGGAIGRLRVSGWLAVMVGTGAQAELSRPRILLDGIGTVRRLGPVTATLWVGPEWIF